MHANVSLDSWGRDGGGVGGAMSWQKNRLYHPHPPSPPQLVKGLGVDKTAVLVGVGHHELFRVALTLCPS